MPAAASQPMPEVTLPDGTRVPALGMGTWHMGEDPRRAAREREALGLGLDLGMRLIDTAEMYGEGGAEEVIAPVIASRRDDVFLVSKVYPHNAGRRAAIAACERSLKRLGTGHLDLYLLHWRGDVPLAETVAAFETLKRDGRIRNWGVSNFDVDDMAELGRVEGGEQCAINQVLYHLGERGIEWALLPWLRERGIPVMAYSPLDEGRLLRNKRLVAIAREAGIAPAAIALAWLVRQRDVIASPKAQNTAHAHKNRAAVDCELSSTTLAQLDAAFPPPREPTPLAII